MGSIIGFFAVLFIVVHNVNGTIDSRRVKKWFGEEDKK